MAPSTRPATGRRRLRGTAVAVAAACLVGPPLLATESRRGAAGAGPVPTFGELPLTFEANAGQTDARVAFLARGAGYTLFLTRAEAVLSLRPASPSRRLARSAEDREEPSRPAVLRLRLRGANESPRVTGLEPREGRSSYFVGNDPSRWRAAVPHFGSVRHEQVYPGIDLVYHGRQRQLEYDFVVQPGADPRRIGLEFEGADRIELDAQGDLLVHVAGATLRQHKPVVYQEREGLRQAVAGRWAVAGRRRAAFRLGDYDRARPLVIDPVLVYSTYLGGASDGERGMAVAVDRSGSVYVAGLTGSTDFPTGNPLQGTLRGGGDIFVAKLNPAGSALVYSTYLGGSSITDWGVGLAVDASGSAYVTGYTASTDFPTVAPIQATNAGGDDAFVAKLSPAGTSLVYSTYLGGSGQDEGFAIAVDRAGSAYVVGQTGSSDFPTAAPLQGVIAGSDDAFVAKLDPSGSDLVYSTYFGGSGWDAALGVAVNRWGAAHVSFYTGSTDFPTVNAIQGALAGSSDAAVAKFYPLGSGLFYSTYLGGSRYESGAHIALDGADNAYVAGDTESTDFPTVNAIQGANAGGADYFVAKLDPGGTALAYSTYLGGSADDRFPVIAVDRAGRAYVASSTSSTDFPTVHAIQAANAGSHDIVMAKLSPSGSALMYSTYLGGSDIDIAVGIAVDGSGHAYVTGETLSVDLPTVNPLQGSLAGGWGSDAFVVKVASLAKGDLDGDGYADLVFRSNADGSQNKVWVMNGVARASETPVSPAAASPDWLIRGVDDFDADDRNDLVFWNQATGDVEFWLMNGATRVGPPVPLGGGPALPVDWTLAATADFNRDGQPDLVWRSLSSQKMVIWTMNGTARTGDIVPSPDRAESGAWAVVAAQDYNADTTPDFLWYNSTSGRIVIWYMNAAVVRTSGQFTIPAKAGDASWKVVASADYSRDHVPGTPPRGSPDIVWRNATSGNQVVWHMDFAGQRVHGEFTNPVANLPALGWTIVGPR